MNKSKKLGIAIFLLLIGSLDAKRQRLINDGDSEKSNKMAVNKAPTPPAHSSSSKKHHKTLKAKNITKPHKKSKLHKIAVSKAPTPPAHSSSSKKHDKKLKRIAKFQVKEVQRKKDRAEAKRNQVRFKDGRFKNYQQEFNYGFMVYHKEQKTELLDAVQAGVAANGLLSNAVETEKDTIEITKSKPAPQVSYVLSAVYENLPSLFKAGKTVEGAMGIQASFAKKNDAYQGTYKDVGVAGDLRTRQSIKKWSVLVFGQYELFRYYGFRYNFKLGTGLSVGALRDLRIYEGTNDLLHNTGQFLASNKSRPTVEFGLNVSKEAGPLDIIFAYDVGYVKQTYSKELYLVSPDAGASIDHTNNFNNLKHDVARHLVTLTPPIFKLWSFNFKLGAGFNF